MIKVKKRQYIIKRHNICLFFIIVFVGDIMKVKIFDESHEEDLEEDINNFIKEEEPDIVDIKFSVSVSVYSEEQLYCFSAMILYKSEE